MHALRLACLVASRVPLGHLFFSLFVLFFFSDLFLPTLLLPLALTNAPIVRHSLCSCGYGCCFAALAAFIAPCESESIDCQAPLSVL